MPYCYDYRWTPHTKDVRGRWKMNTPMFRDKRIQESMKTKWTQLKQHKKYYPGTTLWGSDMSNHNSEISPATRSPSGAKITDKWKNICVIAYMTLHSSMPKEDKWPALQKFKDKIVKLHVDRQKTVLLDTDVKDRIDSEERTLYNVLKMQERRTARKIQKVLESLGHIHETPARNHSNVCTIFQCKICTDRSRRQCYRVWQKRSGRLA